MVITPTYHGIGSSPMNDGLEMQRHEAFLAQQRLFAEACPPTSAYYTRARSSVGMEPSRKIADTLDTFS